MRFRRPNTVQPRSVAHVKAPTGRASPAGRRLNGCARQGCPTCRTQCQPFPSTLHGRSGSPSRPAGTYVGLGRCPYTNDLHLGRCIPPNVVLTNHQSIGSNSGSMSPLHESNMRKILLQNRGINAGRSRDSSSLRFATEPIRLPGPHQLRTIFADFSGRNREDFIGHGPLPAFRGLIFEKVARAPVRIAVSI